MKLAKLALTTDFFSVAVWKSESVDHAALSEGVAICSTDSERGTEETVSGGTNDLRVSRAGAGGQTGAGAACSNGCLCPRERFFVRKELRNASEGRKKEGRKERRKETTMGARGERWGEGEGGGGL